MAQAPPQTKGPENSIVIRNRKELIFLLSEAATLEHMIMCQYLFVSFALKRETSEGVTVEQLNAINRWDQTIVTVAEQEMLHLSLANNLLTAIGAAPFFGRPNFPLRSRYFPSRVRLALMPLDELSLSYFLYLERPESIAIENVPGFVKEELTVDPEAVVPVGQEFATVGQLYRGIEAGLEYLVKKYGEEKIFIGSSAAQATQEQFGWPELVAVKDMASARKAIETIVTEGEGARGDWKNSHFGRFLGILNEYRELKKSDPKFEPSRPVIAAFARPPPDTDANVELIDDRFTAEVSDLFNGSYQVLLQMLSRFFLQVETTGDELQTLSNASVLMMLGVIKPLGRLLTSLPVGPHRPTLTAGPVFEMYPMSHLLPRRRAAWIILNERLVELRSHSFELGSRTPVSNILLAVADSLDQLAKRYEELTLA
ncbi:MAG TPA: ferritin-like domain-containing protein [Candidatus Angelobacter sp.]|nr:ferritin-like domain-containing protein [Candidatus Angelobacter sp.]